MSECCVSTHIHRKPAANSPRPTPTSPNPKPNQTNSMKHAIPELKQG